MAPLVSILIPCFNAERWIARSIESALVQTWPEKEIIVVDDGSTDRSLEVIRQFQGRIHWETGPNRGGNAARNRLLELARGEWLQYLDADDYLLPGKLQQQLDFVSRASEYDVICSPTIWAREESGHLVYTDTEIPEPHDPWILLARWQLPQTGGSLWRRSALAKVGGWSIGQPCCQEHELYLRMLEAGYQFGFCPGCLAVYCDLERSSRVTRRVRGELDRQRLAIFDRMEKCLRERNDLTVPRGQALNDARHQLARKLWWSDRKIAVKILQQIHSADATFRPTVGAAAPAIYLLAYKILGFRGAQIAAAFKRRLSSRWSRRSQARTELQG
jgi:glycosyltransferase involved in cell wall biosynthesis